MSTAPGTHGTLDGTTIVEVLAWATGGTADTVIIDETGTRRVHPARVHPSDYRPAADVTAERTAYLDQLDRTEPF